VYTLPYHPGYTIIPPYHPGCTCTSVHRDGITGREAPGLKTENNKRRETSLRLPDSKGVKVGVALRAELLRLSEEKGWDDRIATG